MDTHNLMWRSHYIHKHLRDSKGRPTGVLYGVLGSLLKMKRHYPDASFVWAWDGPPDVMTIPSVQRRVATKREQGTTMPRQSVKTTKQEKWKARGWRFAAAPTMYKAQRQDKPRSAQTDAEILNGQIKPLYHLLRLAGYCQFRIPGLEGDDLIGILSSIYATYDRVAKVVVDSTDKDFYQLCTDKVYVIRTQSKMLQEMNEDDIYREHGVLPEQWPLYRALTGDSSDGLQGLAKCGPVTAKQLLQAGADPRLDYDQQPAIVHRKATKEDWEKVQLCYLMSVITRVPNDSRLHNRTRRRLASALREPKPRGDLAAFTKALADYDMKGLLSDRHRLQSL